VSFFGYSLGGGELPLTDELGEVLGDVDHLEVDLNSGYSFVKGYGEQVGGGDEDLLDPGCR